MKTRFFTTMMLSLLSVFLFAGDLDGYWQCATNNSRIEVIYTRDGIKVRSLERGGDNWDYYRSYGNNAYRDGSGNCYTLRGNSFEYCSFDKRNVYNFARSNRDFRNDSWNSEGYNTNRDNDYNGTNGDRRDRESWNNYYENFEGKWHNHTSGTHIQVDLKRRNLRIKFHGDRWFDVYERSRGLFVDQKGNQFVFRGNNIEYRSNDNDLVMVFYNDDRCTHRDDYRSEYWR